MIMQNKNFNIRINDQLRKEAALLAEKKGYNLSAYIRELLKEELRKDKEGKREI